jgi:hypothetical protein
MPFPQDKKWGLSCLDVLWLWKSLNTTTWTWIVVDLG